MLSDDNDKLACTHWICNSRFPCWGRFGLLPDAQTLDENWILVSRSSPKHAGLRLFHDVPRSGSRHSHNLLSDCIDIAVEEAATTLRDRNSPRDLYSWCPICVRNSDWRRTRANIRACDHCMVSYSRLHYIRTTWHSRPKVLGLRKLLRLPISNRQRNPKLRPPRMRFKIDDPIVMPNQPPGNVQSQPSTVPHRFRRKEGIEDT